MALESQVTGTKELTRLINALPKKLAEDVWTKSIGAGASELRKHVKRNIKSRLNKQSGNLLKGVKRVKERGTKGMQAEYYVKMVPPAYHAAWFEYGTQFRKFATPHVAYIDGDFAFVTNSGRISPTPYFRPAVYDHQREVMAAINKRAQKELDKTVKQMVGKYGTMKKGFKKKLAA